MNLSPFVYDGTLTWTMTTNGYKFYTLNLITWLREKAKVPWRVCVICCDSESYTFFRREGIPCISYKSSEQKGQATIAAFGSSEFNKWNRVKIDIFKWLCQNAGEMGIEQSLYLDGDIVVQKDPWTVLKEIENDWVFQCDCGHEEEHSGCQVICTGVVRIRHTQPGQSVVFDFDKNLWASCDSDQSYVAARIRQLEIPFLTLPRRQFGNGVWQKTGAWKDGNWVLLHYNYRVGDTKKAAMKMFGHWLLPY